MALRMMFMPGMAATRQQATKNLETLGVM